MAEWYNESMRVEVPSFINHMKDLVKQNNLLLQEKEDLTERIVKGSEIIANIDIDDRVTIQKAVDLLGEINKRIDQINKEIQDIEVEIIAIFEAKLTDLGFIITLPKDKNDINIDIDKRDIYCVPWSSRFEDKEVMTPEDIWFFGMAKKLFNIKDSNIEFITGEHLNK